MIVEMPRGGSRRIADQTLYITVEDLHLCSNHLTNTYWKMCKELKSPLECPVCMTDLINPPVDEMPSGYCLRIAVVLIGCMYHADCTALLVCECGWYLPV